jgi:hypothetical protein
VKREYRHWKRFVFERDHGRCQICSQCIDFVNSTLDHIIPSSRGGSDHHTNLQLACKLCNEDKANKQHFSLGAVIMQENFPTVVAPNPLKEGRYIQGCRGCHLALIDMIGRVPGCAKHGWHK